MDALDADGDGIADVMVLAGGNNPMPSNDVWLTTDGRHWFWDGYADWPKRAYHSSTVFQGKLYITSGTPLNNEVWAGTLVEDSEREVGYTMQWTRMSTPPWLPRVGSCAVTHTFKDTEAASSSNATDNLSNITEALFILGGLAGKSKDHPDHEGIRTRNDVWKTIDGESWTRVSPQSDHSVHWAGRAFHGCISWSNKIYVVGGAYMGTDGNREVRSLEAYTDTWSFDGSQWMKINFEEGSKHQDNLYSTNEWTEITVEGGRTVYRGKWGFSLEPFHYSQDQDSALFLIGGKVEGFSMVSDIFASKQGLTCELGGITCGKQGTCGSAGCICHSTNFTGEYCLDRKVDNQASSAAFRYFLGAASPVLFAVIILLAVGGVVW